MTTSYSASAATSAGTIPGATAADAGRRRADASGSASFFDTLQSEMTTKPATRQARPAAHRPADSASDGNRRPARFDASNRPATRRPLNARDAENVTDRPDGTTSPTDVAAATPAPPTTAPDPANPAGTEGTDSGANADGGTAAATAAAAAAAGGVTGTAASSSAGNGAVLAAGTPVIGTAPGGGAGSPGPASAIGTEAAGHHTAGPSGTDDPSAAASPASADTGAAFPGPDQGALQAPVNDPTQSGGSAGAAAPTDPTTGLGNLATTAGGAETRTAQSATTTAHHGASPDGAGSAGADTGSPGTSSPGTGSPGTPSAPASDAGTGTAPAAGVTTGPASPLEQAAARSVVANGVAEASAAMSASLAAAPLPSTTSLRGAAGTTGAPSATPAALPSHIAELARSAQISADGSARLVVRLDPPELGAVTLHLRSRGSEVEMSLHADTAGGASALAGQQARVRDVLAAHGFDLSRFTIAGRGSDTASGDGTGRDGRPADGRTGAGDFSAPGRDQNGRAAGSAFADFDGSGGSGSRRGAGSRGYPTRSGTTAPDASRGAAAPTQGVWL